MSVNAPHNPPAPIGALEQTWRENASLVERFGVAFEPEGVACSAGSWYVPITVRSQDPNPYELHEAIETLQRDVERRSGLDVTLVVEPFATRNDTPATERG